MMAPDTHISIDALLPAEMAATVERIGVKKTRLDTASSIALAVLAGALVAVGIAVLIFLAAGHGGGAVGANALASADGTAPLSGLQALIHGVLDNVLVCLVTWLCYGARSATDKSFVIIFPIAAFSAAGFEHSIANMFLLSFVLLTKISASADFWTQPGRTPSASTHLKPDRCIASSDAWYRYKFVQRSFHSQ